MKLFQDFGIKIEKLKKSPHKMLCFALLEAGGKLVPCIHYTYVLSFGYYSTNIQG